MTNTDRRNLTALITIPDVPLGLSDEDLASGLRARLAEFYPTDDGYPCVPTRVDVAVTEPDGYRTLLYGANVGLDGADEDTTGIPELDLAHAWQAADDLDRQRLAAEEA